MASIRNVHVIHNCALRINVDQSNFNGIDHTDSSLPWRYEISPEQIKDPRIDKEKFKGWLSPTYKVTLPPNGRKNAGIPAQATTFAYMHPPQGLAELLANDHAIEQKCLQTLTCTSVNVVGVLSAVIMGGFAYFDRDFKCISINAVSDSKSVDTLPFSGPHEVNRWVCEELYQAKRVQPLNLKNFREGGFVSIAWVGPMETFRFRGVFVSDRYNNDHGAMLYFREDGTAVGFRVDPELYDDPHADVGVISEIFGNITSDAGNIYDANIDKNSIQPYHKVKAWANKIGFFRDKLMLSNTTDFTELLVDIKDKKTLLHHACHAALGVDFVTYLLSNNSNEKKNLSYQDEFGWHPLHYACRFCSSDNELIGLLLAEYPRAAMKCDANGRYPLHIACDSDSSVDVINLLLNADTSKHKKTLLTGTKRLGFLPIHFACYKGASGSIIRALLDADVDGTSATKRTSRKQWPLHIAIMKQLPASTIKILLDADSKLRNNNGSFINTGDADVYQRNGDTDDGKLPLHLACWINSPIEVIEMLLTKDTLNSTITEPIPESLEDQAFHKDNLRGSSFVMSYNDSGVGGVALHLAMKHGSKNVINLLLQKEMEIGCYSHSIDGSHHPSYVSGQDFRLSTLRRKDRRGRTPLHIACEHGADPEVIRMLLQLDPNSETTQMSDDQGFRPMHYACENEKTRPETIKILCDAEELYIKKESRGKQRSTHHRDTQRNRTPLYLAVKSNAPIKTIEILLQPQNFVLDGFDDSAMKSLAHLVHQHDNLQEKVVDKLSVRLYWFLNLKQLYAHLIALISFIVASGDLRKGEDVPKSCPILIIVSVIMLTLLEFLEMMSVGANYTFSSRTWFYVVSAFVSLKSAGLMLIEHDHENGESCVTDSSLPFLYVTVFALTLNIIFYFRATFLPFARFVGGVKTIFIKLAPFMIVSTLLVLGFIYSFWMYDNEVKCQKGLNECTKWLLGRIFEYKLDSTRNTISLEFLFMIIILMILLNVVIAIVSDAWQKSREGANLYFWKFRLEKIYAMGFADNVLMKFFSSSNMNKTSFFLNNFARIDSIWNTSYGDSDVSFWEKAPYSIVRKKKHYDDPLEYFSPELAEKINMAKSLHSDLYWAKKKKGMKLTKIEKCGVFFTWLATCLLYVFLILVGFCFFGFFWPRKFRLAFTSNVSTKAPEI